MNRNIVIGAVVVLILILAVTCSLNKFRNLSSGENTWSVQTEKVLEMGR
jgi:outer membrane murein-binding lipoprotein Lpp